MKDKLLSIGFGTVAGAIGGITSEKLIEVIVFSFVGGVIGAIGHTCWKCIYNYFLSKKEAKKEAE